jgi:hypothetical protein
MSVEEILQPRTCTYRMRLVVCIGRLSLNFMHIASWISFCRKWLPLFIIKTSIYLASNLILLAGLQFHLNIALLDLEQMSSLASTLNGFKASWSDNQSSDELASSKWCERCNTIARWVVPDSVSATFDQHELRLVTELGSFDQIYLSSDCPFCFILKAMAQRNEHGFAECRRTYPTSASQYGLYACRSQDTFLSSFGQSKGTNVFVVLSHAIFRYYISQRILSDVMNDIGALFASTHVDRYHSKQLQVREMDSWMINLDVISDWIKECQSKHVSDCSVMKTAEWCPGCPTRLIRCSDKRIVQARGTETYAALSYVWGPPVNPEKTYPSGSILVNIPCTIADSITLASALGFNYIWIDRYCIDKINEDEVHNQISNMHGIYRCAHLTIIAAAGLGPSRGLPGINRQRSQQLFATNDDYAFFLTPPHPKTSIQQSYWATRAWTYQEGICSARRLVFTEDQVYFECRTMRCCESLESNGSDLTKKSTYISFRYNNEDERNACFPRNVVGQHGFVDMMERIAEYTRRHLTYQNDIIKALLGVFGEFERLPDPIYHVWGVPISRIKTDRNGSFHSSSRFSAEEGFVRGLCWQLSRPRRRRPGFPSWSWTGWVGEVLPYNNLYKYFGRFDNVAVWLETNTLSFDRFPSLEIPNAQLKNILQTAGRSLYLEGIIVKVTLHKEPGSPFDRPKYWAVIAELQDGLTIYAQVSLCADLLYLDGSSVEGILMGSSPLFTNGQEYLDGYPVMLFQRKGDYAERIGSFAFQPSLMDESKVGERESEVWEYLKLKYATCKTERIQFQ